MKLISNQNSKNTLLAIASLLLTPCILIAHPGNGDIHTFSDGIQHFFSGVDHLLFSALAGLLILSRQKFWSVPSISAAVAIPLILTGAHQLLLLNENALWTASLGLIFASLSLLVSSALVTQGHILQKSRNQIMRIGFGCALLALALIQR